MQTVIEMSIVPLRNTIQSPPSRVLSVRESRRDVHMPLGERGVYRFEPSVNSGFTDVNLLSATDETMITAQSWCRSMQEIRNSGSD
jgi:hypothetical protein